MKLHLLGVRGSTPVSGADFTRYGGQTSCVAVVLDGSTVPTLLLDAGTGLQQLGSLMGGAPFVGGLVATHLHWDHIQGLPFAPALDSDASEVKVFVPGVDDVSPEDLVAGIMRPPYFPITPRGLGGAWRFSAIPDATLAAVALTAGGISVRVIDIEHKGGRTLAIRIDADGASAAYVPDHALSAGVSDATLALLDGVDVLLHDGQFLDSEVATAEKFGHSTVSQAIELARRCNVGHLVITHHAPGRTDTELDALSRELSGRDQRITVACAGHVVDPQSVGSCR